MKRERRHRPDFVDEHSIVYVLPGGERSPGGPELLTLARRELARLRSEGALPTLAEGSQELELEIVERDTVARIRVFPFAEAPPVALVLVEEVSVAPACVPLTPRQRQVLVLARAGLTNREIAGEVGISPATVRRHMTALYRKLDAVRPLPAFRELAGLRAIAGAAGLTEHQTEIVRHLCLGKRNAEIGLELGISPITVGSHLTKIYTKLGVPNRSALAARVRGSIP